ncbi:MAG: hypothetical protein FWB96_08665 [Defluviitaleaceae bacterium]|nr:hypothetical protein [Defluviitaleaceae bacterium]MCL2263695.1 hypothetical protein [Defluviitaleaceae bacterium]
MWKYESCDIESISLHDHSIDTIRISDNNISLIFNEGFDVAKTHPLNGTGKSKHTDTSQIVLKNAKFLSGAMHRWAQQEMNCEQEKFDLAWFHSASCSFEVLDWELGFNAEDGMVKLCGNMFSNDAPNGEYSELEFSCNNVLFCWNNYVEDAWFEGWPERTS